MSFLTDIGKKLGVIRSAYKPIQLTASPYNPPPAGSRVNWTRAYGQNTPGKRGAFKVRQVHLTRFTPRSHAVFIGVLGLFPARIVVTRSLQVSHFGPHAPGVPMKGAVSGRRRFDPYGDFNFVVEIEGVNVGAFQKVDGLSIDVDEIEYRDSLDPHPRKRPGIHRYNNIKLTKGVIENTSLWRWCQNVMAGEIDRRNGTIHILNDSGDKTKPDVSYHFYGAWPCKWSGLRVDGKGGATLVEEMELALDHFNRA